MAQYIKAEQGSKHSVIYTTIDGKYFRYSGGWLSTDETIKLAQQDRLDLEICTSKLGKSYLRARKNSSFQKDLNSLVVENHEK